MMLWDIIFLWDIFFTKTVLRTGKNSLIEHKRKFLWINFLHYFIHTYLDRGMESWNACSRRVASFVTHIKYINERRKRRWYMDRFLNLIYFLRWRCPLIYISCFIIILKRVRKFKQKKCNKFFFLNGSWNDRI